jgi:hypothetical protein
MAQALPLHLARVAEAGVTNALREARTRLDVRRAASIALGLHGLRGQEVCNLNRGDLDAGKRTLTVHTIKRGRRRILTLDPLLCHTLVKINSSGKRDEPLICGLKKRRMDRKTIWRYGRWLAWLLKARCTFHSLRHTAAHRVYNATGDVLTVHRMLGHSTLHQTHVYLQTTTPIPEELGPRLGGWLPQAELHAWPGPMDALAGATSIRHRLVAGRLPPARGIHTCSTRAVATRNATATIKKKLNALQAIDREHVLRALILHEWPRDDDPRPDAEKSKPKT